ncbi:MAG: hypothetical protein LUF30_09435, partial [Lachnospiraceae bacterium]|nr:hypothetical protein [Lachnospiraceae bacterium]
MNIISGLAPYIPVYFSACLVDAVAAGAPGDTLRFYAALTVGLTFLISLLNNLFSNLYAQTMGSWYRAEGWSYSEKAMELSYSSIEDHDIAQLRTRVQVESQTGFNRWYLHRCISELTYYFCQILTSGIFLLPFFGNFSIAIGWKLLFGAAVLLNLFSVIWTNKMKSRLDMERSEKNVDINQYMNRCGSFINDYKNGQEIRLYGMHDLLASL